MPGQRDVAGDRPQTTLTDVPAISAVKICHGQYRDYQARSGKAQTSTLARDLLRHRESWNSRDVAGVRAMRREQISVCVCRTICSRKGNRGAPSRGENVEVTRSRLRGSV